MTFVLAFGVVLMFPLSVLPSHATLTGQLSAPETAVLSDEDALKEDIENIARYRSVSTDEVEEEFTRIDDAASLQADLSITYPDEFGGLFISEDSSELTVAWKGDVGSVPQILLLENVVVVPAVFSEEELIQAQVKASHELQDVEAEVWTDVTTNRVVVEIDESEVSAVEQLIESALLTQSAGKNRTASSSPIEVVERGDRVTAEKSIIAGKATSTCTSGFAIKNNSSETRYLTTAGHCRSSQTFDGTSATFVKEWWNGNYDIQIHKPSSGNSASAKFLANGKTRTVTGKTQRANMVVGSSVCKQGKTTGYTCGRIASKNASGQTEVNSSGKSYVMVRRDIDYPGKISDGGDSGGPWFVGNVAHGWHHAGNGKYGDGSRSYFMTTDYIPSGYSLVIG